MAIRNADLIEILFKNYHMHKYSFDIFIGFSWRNSGNNYPAICWTMATKSHYFFIRFTREKTQNNFSSQNFSVENNYLFLQFPCIF